MKPFEKNVTDVLMSGGVGVLPTDTVYGIVARAENENAVERVYRLRKRDLRKPCIVLISSENDLQKFGVEMTSAIAEFFTKYSPWPGKVSIVFPVSDAHFEYLTRGTGTIAFRMPAPTELRDLLVVTGPLIAPSANTEGDPPSPSIADARKYFGDTVDFYVDAGTLQSELSTVITFENGAPVVLRQGAFVLK